MSQYIDKYGVGLLAKKVKQAAPSHLSRILDIPKCRALSNTDLATLWKEHYATRPFHVAMSMSSQHFGNWMRLSRQHPMCIVPLSKPLNGWENFVVQHQHHDDMYCQVGFTKLNDYQNLGAASRPAMTINAYGEFAVEGGIGLLSGSFDGVTRDEATVLLAGCSEIYTKLADHVRLFNENPGHFDYNAFLAAYQSVMMHRQQ